MNILVTGAAGFLGSHLVDRLVKDGHTVYGIDNFIGSNPQGEKEVGFIDAGKLFKNKLGERPIASSQQEYDQMAGLLKSKTFDVVYHLAAVPHEGLSVFSPVTVAQHTYMSTVSTAVFAINSGCKRFIFTSSMARYGNPKWSLPFSESLSPEPVDPYGVAKLAAENTLRILGREHGMEIVILVPHNIYGPRQRYWDPYRNVVGIMANLMLQGRQPIIYGDGKQQRCFSYVDDCIEPMVNAMTAPVAGEVINIGPDRGLVRINELALLLHEIIHGPQTVVSTGPGNLICGPIFEPKYVPERPAEVKIAYCDGRKSRELLGYSPKVGLREGLQKTVAWMREQGPRKFEYHLPIEIQSERLPITWKERLF